MEEAVLSFRAGDVGAGRRVPLEVLFMTTHSISENRYVGGYASGARMCGQPNSSMLAPCLEMVSE